MSTILQTSRVPAPSTYLLAIDWAGAEGNALSLLAAEGAGQFKEIITESWYRSPL